MPLSTSEAILKALGLPSIQDVCLGLSPHASCGFRFAVPMGLADDSPPVPPDSSLWVWG